MKGICHNCGWPSTRLTFWSRLCPDCAPSNTFMGDAATRKGAGARGVLSDTATADLSTSLTLAQTAAAGVPPRYARSGVPHGQPGSLTGHALTLDERRAGRVSIEQNQRLLAEFGRDGAA